MRILAIESTCDETGAAIVEPADAGVKVLGEALASSAKIHIQYGGVVPEVAAREQLKTIIPVVESVLKEAQLRPADLDALAVATGPGLVGSLLVGVETAKALALAWQKPIISVNHLVAHIFANWIDTANIPQFPALALVVSGGHTDLIYLHDARKWHWLGGTRDDAAGECFDKCARILGLGYPGGPALETAALAGHQDPVVKLPRPLLHEPTLDLSFSGLKSALGQALEKDPGASRSALAAEVIQAVVDSLVVKTELALNQVPAKSLILAGGVAANELLRQRLSIVAKNARVSFYTPQKRYCTDNPAMVGAAALFRPEPTAALELTVSPNLEVV